MVGLPRGPGAPGGTARIRQWFEDRFDLEGLRKFALGKSVPIHKHSVWYFLGGSCLFLFVVQVVTGVLLMVYYRPSEPHASVEQIMTQVDFGWLVRSVHAWSANLLILLVFVHMFSTMLMRAYRRPRELTWLAGMALLGMMMAFGFSGYLLPWDEVSFFATKIGIDIAGKVPVVGSVIAEMLRGGGDVTTNTVQRFYVLHVWVLPALAGAVLGFHLLLIQVLGVSAPVSWERLPEDKRKAEPFFPDFLTKDMLVWAGLFALVVLLAVLWPSRLGKEADPIQPAPIGIKPEWYFLSQYQFLKLIPSRLLGIDGELVGVLLINLIALFAAALPFIDTREPGTVSYRVFRVLLPLGVLGFVVLTVWGKFS